MYKDIWLHLQEPEGVLTVFHVPAYKVLTPAGNQESGLGMSPRKWPFSSYADLVQRKSGHHSTQVGGHINKDAGLPLKYSDLVNAVTSRSVYSKCLRQLPKLYGAIHQSSQPVRNWKIDYIGLNSQSESSKYALVYIVTASGLTQAIPHCCTNHAALLGIRVPEYHVQISLLNRQWFGVTFEKP